MRIPLVIGVTVSAFATMLAAPVGAASPLEDTSSDDRSRTVAAGEASEQAKKKRFTCRGEVATIVGNRRNNHLEGTPGRDVIVGRGGGDVIIGRGGRDIICGGRGGDVLIGLAGRDKLYGGPRKDQCFGENSEHRFHYGCEVHRNPLGEPVAHPHSPKAAALGAPTSAPPATASGKTAKRGAATADRPYCSDGRIDLGRFYFAAQFQNPGWVAVRPVYAQWNEFAGGYGADVAATDWQMYNAPLDGQYYYVDMGSFNIGPGMSVWGYQIYWWNGAQWVDGQLFAMPKFANAGASAAFTYNLSSCVT